MKKLTLNTNIKSIAMAVGMVFSGVVLTGCNEKDEIAIVNQVVKPAMYEVVSSSANGQLVFNGVVQAAERAELAFRVGGRLVNILVKEGEAVKKGQLLAALDSNDAEIALASANLELSNLEVEYKRAKTLYEKNRAISKSDLDEVTTRYNLAVNKKSEALRQLNYTKIEAPFDGNIGLKLVDNYTQIQPHAPVFTLHNLENMEAVINIPDTVMLSGSLQTKAQAEIRSIPNQQFALTLRSYATEASADTQAYPVILGFDDLKGYRVLPGMTVKVIPQEDSSQAKQISLPVAAVVPDNKGKQYVWVIGADNKVSKRFVSVGQLNGNRVMIKENLNQDEKVVIAGVSGLIEGMEVRPVEHKSNGVK